MRQDPLQGLVRQLLRSHALVTGLQAAHPSVAAFLQVAGAVVAAGLWNFEALASERSHV